jgi:OOP family OmpA-OmpF porin
MSVFRLSLPILLSAFLLPSAGFAAGPAKAKGKAKAGGKVEAKAGKGEKAKKPKKAKKTNERAVKLDAERSSAKGMKKWRPEEHMLNFGVFGGISIPSKSHGLFDPGEGDRPTLSAIGGDVGARLEYFPLSFLGLGFEGAAMPIKSPSEGTTTAAYGVRASVIGQLPYRVAPFLLFGGGALGNNSGFPILNSDRGAFHWGGGLKFFLNKWLAVRLDGRHVVAGAGTSRFSHGEVSVGLDITLRLRDWIKPRNPRDGDGDADGVADSKDDCPATPGSDGHGCPPHLRDVDDDGIKDAQDDCPRQWADTPSGCPLQDKDSDGIPDGRDGCVDDPENQNGWEDSDGCPDEIPADVAAFSGVIKGINFDTGKASIKKKSHKVLKNAASTLRSNPEMQIEVVGHTDNQGDRAMNVDLSQRRADAVKSYLVEEGVEAERIYTRGSGPDEPIADNKSKKGRAKNRRIEFRLISH